MFLFGVSLAGSPANAQSDSAARAPWQAPPNQRVWPASTEVPYSYDNSPAQAQLVQDVPNGPQGRAAMPSGYSEQGGSAPAYPGDPGGCATCRNGACSSGECDDGCDGDWRCDANFFMPCNRLWVSAEYLAWWGKSANLPPLVTTSPNGTARAEAGVLGQTGTTILFGGDGIDESAHSGGRFTIGCWLSPCRDEGLEVTYMFLGNQATNFDQTSQGNPILARPFLNVQTGLQDSVVIAFPDQQTGSVHISLNNELNSVEMLYRQACVKDCGRELDLLFGYRYAQFAENFAANASTTYTSTVSDIPVGTVIATTDAFSTTNIFNGAEVGISARTHYCCWSLDMTAKLALGNTQSRVSINGSTVTTSPGQTPVTSTGGVLALPTNIGNFERNAFSAMPELGATLGYDLTCHLKATVGYTLLYWSQVARPGDQIDTNLNTSQFPSGQLTGMPSPQVKFVTTDFWAQGLNVGLDYRF
jgi:hypothetical protein